MDKIKNKRLKLRASQRDNRRYLVVAGNNEDVKKAILDYIGILGMARAAYLPVKVQKNRVVGSVRREELEKVKAALAFAGLKVERVSGTIKGLGF